MFQNAFQSGAFLEVFDAKGKNSTHLTSDNMLTSLPTQWTEKRIKYLIILSRSSIPSQSRKSTTRSQKVSPHFYPPEVYSLRQGTSTTSKALGQSCSFLKMTNKNLHWSSIILYSKYIFHKGLPCLSKSPQPIQIRYDGFSCA